MKSTLYLKFAIIYIVFGFLSLFTVGYADGKSRQHAYLQPHQRKYIPGSYDDRRRLSSELLFRDFIRSRHADDAVRSQHPA